MTKKTLGIGFIMWDKIGPVWKLFLCLSIAWVYAPQFSLSRSYLRKDKSHKDSNGPLCLVCSRPKV